MGGVAEMRWAYRGEGQGASETTVRTRPMTERNERWSGRFCSGVVSPILRHSPTSAPGVAYDDLKSIPPFPRSIPARPLASYVRCRGVQTRLARCVPATEGVLLRHRATQADGDWTPYGEGNPPPTSSPALRFLALGDFLGRQSLPGGQLRLFPARPGCRRVAGRAWLLAWHGGVCFLGRW